MSTSLVKTHAIVLRKINFGDSSKIAHFFTEEFGKLSAIVKGARSPKSKMGSLVDTMNVVEIILYKKDSRDVQLISNIDLIKHHSKIRDDYEKHKYALSIIELLQHLTVEHEPHKKLYSGSVKMLSLIEDTAENPKLLFLKYYFFFLKEIGYEFQLSTCNVCGNKIKENEEASYNFEAGIICKECRKDRLTNFDFTMELMNLMRCLNARKNDIKYTDERLDVIIKVLEKYLTYNIHEFKGIKSLKMV